ncbi:MAG: prenyltransferase [Planctomycetes bacterium]|nr:prenyltransferase [Planctomycetota bacterium]
MIPRRLAILLLAAAACALPAAEPADELSAPAKTAVARGLTWLVKAQKADGSFGGTGLTGAALLAVLATGSVPGRGPRGEAAARAVQSLLRQARPDGLIHQQGDGSAPMYNHGLATLALAEVWGESAEPKVRETLRRAVDLIVSTQNQRGGWRYQPRADDDDLSVTVMQLMALRAAKDAGLLVPKDCIDLGIAYVKSCHNPRAQGKDGGFAYTPGGGSGPGRTGAGVTSLQVAGNYRAGEVQEGVAYLLGFQPLGSEEVKEHSWYAWYYATMGIYQAQSAGPWGREAWRRWYPAMVGHLCRTQHDTGRWGDGVYPTSMALLMLAVPYRCLPVYQR